MCISPKITSKQTDNLTVMILPENVVIYVEMVSETL